MLSFDEKDRPLLQRLYDQGQQNGVEGLEILEAEQVRRLEPEVSENVVAALHAPSGGIVCPFGLTIALAENAAVNGVEFRLNTEVERIEKLEEGYRLITNRGIFRSAGCECRRGVRGSVPQHGERREDPYHTQKGRILSHG